MLRDSIRKKCPRCSKFSFALSAFIRRLFALATPCERIFNRLPDDKTRIATLNSRFPDCVCEGSTTSKYSPYPVHDDEVLARFVFDPMHVSRDGSLKPSLFSHVIHNGCSIQRDTIATPQELSTFVKSFLERQLAKKPDCKWHGVVTTTCQKIRELKQDDSTRRSVCVFDTAERANQAHGELFQTQYVIDEADQRELIKLLLDSFSDSFTPSSFRHGEVLNALSPSLREHCSS